MFKLTGTFMQWNMILPKKEWVNSHHDIEKYLNIHFYKQELMDRGVSMQWHLCLKEKIQVMYLYLFGYS